MTNNKIPQETKEKILKEWKLNNKIEYSEDIGDRELFDLMRICFEEGQEYGVQESIKYLKSKLTEVKE